VASAARVAANENLFREVNKRLLELEESVGDGSHSSFVCECASRDCIRRVDASLDEYRQVREDPRHFMVADEHVNHEHERIVRSNARFTVVEKFGPAGELAEDLDRSDEGAA
jgi:hypothetical protein